MALECLSPAKPKLFYVGENPRRSLTKDLPKPNAFDRGNCQTATPLTLGCGKVTFRWSPRQIFEMKSAASRQFGQHSRVTLAATAPRISQVFSASAYSAPSPRSNTKQVQGSVR